MVDPRSEAAALDLRELREPFAARMNSSHGDREWGMLP